MSAILLQTNRTQTLPELRAGHAEERPTTQQCPALSRVARFVVLGWALLSSLVISACHDSTSGSAHDMGVADGSGGSPDGPTGVSDGSTGAADGATTFVDCPGVPLPTSGTRDVDLHSVRVSGAMTLNRAVLPDGGVSRGSIVFRDQRTGTAATFDLGATGAGHYDVLLAPGKYDILWSANKSLCTSATNSLPCIGGVLKSDFTLSTSGTLDLDLPSLIVQGRVTVQGAAVAAADQQSGLISFKAQSGDIIDTAASGTGLASYRLVLLHGTYDISYQGPASCSAGSPLPCIAAPLKSGLLLTASGNLDLNIPTVQTSGRTLVNGQPVPSTDFGRGTLAFQLRGGGSTATAAATASGGLAPYQLTLVPGTYDVVYLPRNNDCTAATPCIGGVLKRGISLNSSGVLDIDIPLITVQGSVTISGQAVDAANELGSLVFRGADGYSVFTATTGPRQLATYKLTLIPGTYQIDYAPQNTSCTNLQAKGPCIGGPLKKDSALTTSAVLDFNIPSITVNGRITVSGSPPASTALSRGQLIFQLSGGQSVGTQNLGAYQLRLLPGSYALSYAFLGSECQLAEAVPCASGLLRPGQSLTSAGTLDVDLPLVRVDGRVTLNGTSLPNTSATRGRLQFTLDGSAFLTPDFSNSGTVNYRVALLPGSYVIAHQPDYFRCSATPGGIPCVSQVLAGCR